MEKIRLSIDNILKILILLTFYVLLFRSLEIGPMGLGTNILGILFFVTIIFFNVRRALLFGVEWTIFSIFVIGAVYARQVADDMSPVGDTTLYWVHHLEVNILKIYPQPLLNFIFDKIYLQPILTIVYYSFFTIPIVAAFLIWILNRQLFFKYLVGTVLLFYTSIGIYYLFPTAPPWMAFAEYNNGIQLTRPFVSHELIETIELSQYLKYGNLVAAFPSYHVAWVAYLTYFFNFYYKRKYSWLLHIYPILMSMSVIYGNEHYLLDAIFGYFLAWVIYKIIINLNDIKISFGRRGVRVKFVYN